MPGGVQQLSVLGIGTYCRSAVVKLTVLLCDMISFYLTGDVPVQLTLQGCHDPLLCLVHSTVVSLKQVSIAQYQSISF